MPLPDIRKAASLAVWLVVSTAGASLGQQPTPIVDSVLPRYHPPLIALAQPGAGGVLPQDKPVVVIRFAAGEPGDPVDARSFSVSVDGKDATSLFQVSAGEAWGPLAKVPADLPLGSHEVAARICSIRGACSDAKTPVTIAAPTVAGVSPDADKPVSRKRRVLDALLGALRSLLK